MMLRIAVLFALAGALTPAAPKNRDWQTGTLLDAEHNGYFGGGQNRPDTTVSLADAKTGTQFHFTIEPAAGNLVLDHYVIESETDVYLVDRMRLGSAKPPVLVVNARVRFAVEKKKLWLLDAAGRELQTTIAQQKAKLQSTQ